MRRQERLYAGAVNFGALKMVLRALIIRAPKKSLNHVISTIMQHLRCCSLIAS